MTEGNGVVFVIDDDDFILELHSTLLREAGFEVRSFASAEAFLTSYKPGACECILTDLRMPAVSGRELYETLTARGIDTPVIFITGHANVPGAVEAMRQGAFDYVPKPVHGAQLIERVKTALAVSQSRYSERQARVKRKEQLAQLTPQEHKIALWIAQGHSNREMAEKAGLSVRTVENHRARIMDKLQAHSVVEVVRLLLSA